MVGRTEMEIDGLSIRTLFAVRYLEKEEIS
jgi:hypothetical protein